MENLSERIITGEVSKNLAELALKITLEEALSACTGVKDVEARVELPGKVRVMCYYEVGKDVSLRAARLLDPLACPGDLIPRIMEVGDLPAKVVREVKRRFPVVLEELKTEGAYKLWKQKVHRAVEGTIAKVDTNAAWVDLGDQMGIMPRSHWIPKEALSYKPGKAFWFYVLKVVKDDRALRVYLSRNSIGLPGALLREMAPGVKVKCARRIAGARSWLVVGRRLERSMMVELGRRLGGERLVLLYV